MRTPFLFVLASSVSGCCFAPSPLPDPAPLPALPIPVDPVAITPPPAPMPGLDPTLSLLGDPFDLPTTSTPQVPGVRSLFDAARPASGELRDTVLVCAATLLGGGYDDSLFAGGADVALAMRIGEGALRSTPQSSERVYSFPVASLAPGENVWIRVLDRDVLFDDTIAEGATAYERAPFRLTMGQANVECRALDPSRVAEERGAARARLTRTIERLPAPAPDLAAADLGYPSTAVASGVAAARELGAWSDPSAPALADALAPAHAWHRSWSDAVSAAVEEAGRTLPPPSTPVADGRAEVSVVATDCGREAMRLRAEIGEVASATAPSTGCIVRLRLRGHAPFSLGAATETDETWTIGTRGEQATARVLAVQVGGAWRSIDPGPVSLEGDLDVAIALAGDQDAPLLRLGAPFAHAQVLRLR